MLYALKPELTPISPEQYDSELLTAGYIAVDELESVRSRFGLSEAAVNECFAGRERYRNVVDVYEDHLFGMVDIVDVQNVMAANDRVAFFIKRNLLLLCALYDEDGSTRVLFDSAVRRFRPENVTLEMLLYAVLDATVNQDAGFLAKMEFDISEMEGAVTRKEADADIDQQIYDKKKQLLALRNYYEQLIDIGEGLEENENGVFDDGAMHYFTIFTNKCTRLSGNVQMLRDALTQLREAHQAAMDYSLNNTMKLLTIVTVIFMPLTLLVGWYGMNFQNMPELSSRFGYPVIIAVSLLLVALSVLWFKRKKML